MFLADVSKLYDFSFLLNKEVVMGFISGIGTTISIAFLGVLIGIIIGIFLAIGKLLGNKPIRAICVSYINFVRGTPLLLQLTMVYYIPTYFFPGISLPSYLAGVIAIGLNSAAYVAEIYRGGILSIDKGQLEAARSLGMNYKQSLKLIIIPQATKNVLPTLGNEFISVIKETAIVSVIATKDLMFYANQIRNTTSNPFPSLFLAAMIYFVIVMGLTKVVEKVEEKLKND